MRLGMDLLSASAKVDETLGLDFAEAPNLPVPTDTAATVAEMSKLMAGLR